MSNRSDNFNRADTTNAIGTPSDGGSAWVQQNGTWGITATSVAYDSGSPNQDTCVLESSSATVDVQVTLSTYAGNLGLVARAVDNNNYILLLIDEAGTPNMTFYKRVVGSFIQISIASVGAQSNGVVIKLNANSTTLTGYINGVSKLTGTDAAGLTNTKHGIRCSTVATNNGRFDDFSITDNAGGGPVLRMFTLLGVG